METSWTMNLRTRILSALVCLCCAHAPAQAQDWVWFEDETALRFCPTGTSCPAELAGGDGQEKDLAVGDIDLDGDLDLVVVRKERASTRGGRTNFLLLNTGGTLVARNDLITGFNDVTDDRDVVLDDFNSDGCLDVVTVTTFGEMPRVYLNRGMAGGGCAPDGTWLGFAAPVTLSFPTSPGPQFCAAGFGDVDGGNGPDLYFTDYNKVTVGLEDRLLVNDGAGGFTDVTGASGAPALGTDAAKADFGTDAHIVDLNGDGCADVVKASGNAGVSLPGDPEEGIFVLYNERSSSGCVGASCCTGRFPDAVEIYGPAAGTTGNRPYMVEPADFNDDGRIDLFVVDDGQDSYLINLGNDAAGQATFSEGSVVNSPNTTGFGGNVKIADLNRDSVLDVLVADFDTDSPGCTRKTVLLRGGQNGSAFGLEDPISGGARGWLPSGVFDLEPFDLDADGCVDMVMGVCNCVAGACVDSPSMPPRTGWKIFMQRLPSDALSILEPSGTLRLPTTGSRRFLVRLGLAPVQFGLADSQFEAFLIPAGLPDIPANRVATSFTGARVGDQYWLSVEPAGGIDLGRTYRLKVTYDRCSDQATAMTGDLISFTPTAATDMVMVVDVSTSMRRDRKFESAKNAASLLINTLQDDDKVGVVWFSGTDSTGYGIADTQFAVARAGDPENPGVPAVDNRMAAIRETRALALIGDTPIGEGLLRGAFELNSIPAADRAGERALVLLSDGQENVPNFWSTPPPFAPPSVVSTPVQGSFGMGSVNEGVKIHTMSLGPSASHIKMAEISTHTGGQPLEIDIDRGTPTAFIDRAQPFGAALAAASTGLSSLSLPNRLASAYEHAHNASSRQERLWQGSLVTRGSDGPVVIGARPSQEEIRLAAGPPERWRGSSRLAQNQLLDRIAVPVEPGVDYATLAVNWPESEGIEVVLTPPPGQDPATIARSDAPTNTVFRIDRPVAGDWLVDVAAQKGLEVMVTLSGRGTARGFGRAALPTGRTLAPGAVVPLAIALFDTTGIRDAEVKAVASSANGNEPVTLTDDGLGSDDTAGDGIYTGALRNTARGGAIAVEVLAQWTGGDGFTRERIIPIAVQLPELDSDGDGVSDEDEDASGVLDPNDPNDANADPDGDGLASWRELELDLDPLDPDSDDGGMNDGAELCRATDPRDPADDDQGRVDSDGDGLPDPWETRFGFDPNDPGDAGRDRDRDRLSNREEFELCTSPVVIDTDGDGRGDGEEVTAGTDPRDGRPGDTGPGGPGTPPIEPPDEDEPKYAVSIHLGLTEPQSSLADFVDGDALFEIDFERRLSPRWTIEGVFGRYEFQPGFEIDGLTVYAKYWWLVGSTTRLYAGGGAGYYDPAGGTATTGVSSTIGADWRIAPRWRFDLGIAGFHLFERGVQDEIDFAALKLGFKFDLH